MLHMKRSTLMAINIFVLTALITTLALSGFFLYKRSSDNIASAHKILPEIGTYASQFVSPGRPVQKGELYNLRLLLLENRNLKSFIIYGRDFNILYAYARSPRYLRFPDSESVKRSQINIEKIKFFDTHVINDIDSKTGFYSEGVFEVFPYERALYICKLCFAAFFFIFILLFITLILSSHTDDAGKVSIQTSPAPPINPRHHIDDGQGEDFHDEMMYTPDSMLCFEEYFPERLDNELRRAASFDQDLVLAFLRCKTGRNHKNFINLAEKVRNYFSFHDLLFEYSDDIIAIILPNNDIDEGITHLSEFQKGLVFSGDKCDFSISAGLSSRNGRLISHDRIINEALSALKKAESEHDTPIVGFRPDPGKYRSFIASRSV